MFLVNRSCNQGEHVSIFSSLRLHLSPPLLAQFVVVLGKCILCEMSFEKREETFNLWVNNCLWSSLVKNTEEVCRVRRSPGGWWYVPEIKSLPVSQSLAVHSAWPKWNEKVPAPHWPDPRRSTPSTRLLEEEVGWGERDKLIEMENKRWKLPIDYHSLYTLCGPYFVSLMCPFNKSFCKLPWLCHCPHTTCVTYCLLLSALLCCSPTFAWIHVICKWEPFALRVEFGHTLDDDATAKEHKKWFIVGQLLYYVSCDLERSFHDSISNWTTSCIAKCFICLNIAITHRSSLILSCLLPTICR